MNVPSSFSAWSGVLCLCLLTLLLSASGCGERSERACQDWHALLPRVDAIAYPEQVGPPDGHCIAYVDLVGGAGVPSVYVPPSGRAYPWAPRPEDATQQEDPTMWDPSGNDTDQSDHDARTLVFFRFPKYLSARDFIMMLIPLNRAMTPRMWSGGIRVAVVDGDGRLMWARIEEGGSRATLRWVLREGEEDQQVAVFLRRGPDGGIAFQVYDYVRRVPRPGKDVWAELRAARREKHNPRVSYNVMVQPDLALAEWLPAFLRLQHKLGGIGRFTIPEE